MAKRKRHSSRDTPQFWPVAYIKDEDKSTGRYLVVWEGPYDPTWEPRKFVNQPAIDEWERRHGNNDIPATSTALSEHKPTQHALTSRPPQIYAPPINEMPSAVPPPPPMQPSYNSYAVQRPDLPHPRETDGAESVTTAASDSLPVSPMMRSEMLRRVSFTESQASTDGAPPVKRPVIRRPPPQRGHTPVRIIRPAGWR